MDTGRERTAGLVCGRLVLGSVDRLRSGRILFPGRRRAGFGGMGFADRDQFDARRRTVRLNRCGGDGILNGF